MTRIYLVRHGTTDWNTNEIFRGRVDCPLNAKGRAEAQALAEYFRVISLNAIYSSPLARAAETAAMIAGSKALTVIADPAFTDIDFGLWQGKSISQVKEAYGEIYRRWKEEPETVIFPGGESLAQMGDRAWKGFIQRVEENDGKTFLLVSHRVVIKVLMLMVLGSGLTHFWRIRQDPAAVSCVDFDGRIFITSFLNETAHLPAPPPADF